MKKIILFVSVVICCGGFSFSQNALNDLQHVLKEKTEWRERARVTSSHNASRGGRSLGESIVSDTSLIESEVHAAINPADSNNIVVSSNYVGGGFIPDQTNFIYYTNDFGNSWHTSDFKTVPQALNSFIIGGGDPNFAFNAQGKAYFSWINLWADAGFNTFFDLYWASSTDGGNNWDRNTTNDYIGSSPVSFFGGGGGFDKQWMASDNNPASSYYGNLYCSFFQITDTISFIGLRRKLASASAFDTTSAKVNSGTYKFVQFASSAVDRNGGVHVSFFASEDSASYSLYHAVSTNGGVSFSPETKISDATIGRFTAGRENDTILGIGATRLYPCAYIAADATAGSFSNNLYMVWSSNGTDTVRATGYDIYFSRSGDGGANWSSAQILNDNTTNLSSDQFYPAITVSPKGRVIVSWSDRRDDPQNNATDIYLAYSDDGGATFASNVKVILYVSANREC